MKRFDSNWPIRQSVFGLGTVFTGHKIIFVSSKKFFHPFAIWDWRKTVRQSWLLCADTLREEMVKQSLFFPKP